MARNRATVVKISLTSLMDVFTILVFFLLVNSATTEVLETPKQITLPASVVEEKPRETVVIFISPTEVTVQGASVALVSEILETTNQDIAAIGERLAEVSENIIGLRTQIVAESQEITILADRSVPFSVIKKVMSTCTSRETPGSLIVTPLIWCAISIVILLCVTTMNCTESDISRTMLEKRTTLASSSGASTSSSRQNGAGFSRKIENTKATAVRAFSPPDSKCRLVTRLPGGWAMMVTPVVSRSSPVSSR